MSCDRSRYTEMLAGLSEWPTIPFGVLGKAKIENPWFTEKNIRIAFDAIRKNFLSSEKVSEWLKHYPDKSLHGKKIGIIMAGNIPMVGFSDLWSVVLTGAEACVKLSSKDTTLMQWMIQQITRTIPSITVRPLQENDQLDAIIATGSDNANRYFRAFYGHIPSVFRGNRYSLAVLSGNESEEELSGLWEDVFLYYGLGCRNVSHLLVPENFDPQRLIRCWTREGKRITHPMFLHNYLQNKAIMRMEEMEYFDGKYFTLSREKEPSFWLSHLTYSFYRSEEDATAWIENRADRLQCVVSNLSIPYKTTFGKSQYPELQDYPDHVDLMDFLHAL